MPKKTRKARTRQESGTAPPELQAGVKLVRTLRQTTESGAARGRRTADVGIAILDGRWLGDSENGGTSNLEGHRRCL